MALLDGVLMENDPIFLFNRIKWNPLQINDPKLCFRVLLRKYLLTESITGGEWRGRLWCSLKLCVWYLLSTGWHLVRDVGSTDCQSYCPAGKWIKTDSFHYFRRGNILINNFTKPVRASLGNWIIYQYIGLHQSQDQYILLTGEAAPYAPHVLGRWPRVRII